MALRLVLRKHAAHRMLQRGITMAEIEKVVTEGEVIEDYPGDRPFPSRLLLGWTESGPLHVVIADEENVTCIITAYRPDPLQWDSTFRRQRS
jgi:hypothetical protein